MMGTRRRHSYSSTRTGTVEPTVCVVSLRVAVQPSNQIRRCWCMEWIINRVAAIIGAVSEQSAIWAGSACWRQDMSSIAMGAVGLKSDSRQNPAERTWTLARIRKCQLSRVPLTEDNETHFRRPPCSPTMMVGAAENSANVVIKKL
jgi:hypothetical protein